MPMPPRAADRRARWPACAVAARVATRVATRVALRASASAARPASLATGARIWALGLMLAAAAPAHAEPRVPASDDEVVERLPARRADPALRDLARLREQLAARPGEVAAAVALAERAVALGMARGDPRYLGQAQAALAPWWQDPAPPPAVRMQRALIRQFFHDFDGALADLDAVVARQPDHGPAWAWLAALHLVRQGLEPALKACHALGGLGASLVATVCQAQVDALRGRSGPALAAMLGALRSAPQAPPAQRLWALTRVAETAAWRGDTAVADAAFNAALALEPELEFGDVYLLAAWADHALAQGRAAAVLERLAARTDADVLLLRAALAASRLGDARAPGWVAELDARFGAARARGDATHRKEQARHELELKARPAPALALARANYELQREVADALMLLQAARAAADPTAAAPVLRWMEDAGVDLAVLRQAAAALAPAAGGGRR